MSRKYRTGLPTVENRPLHSKLSLRAHCVENGARADDYWQLLGGVDSEIPQMIGGSDEDHSRDLSIVLLSVRSG
jgi:hypothetical protein